jgi:hypothetical protein
MISATAVTQTTARQPIAIGDSGLNRTAAARSPRQIAINARPIPHPKQSWPVKFFHKQIVGIRCSRSPDTTDIVHSAGSAVARAHSSIPTIDGARL